MSVIQTRNISKKFRIYHEKTLNLKYAVINFLTGKRSSYYDEFYALRDINLDIKKGETVGLIGENGSGKSTLLKIIARILYPDDGTVVTSGKIASLIEIGAGFHSELSGRENVYINGSILGFTKKQIEARLDEIIAFSGLERFIDNPIKTYSSGMYVRLGFSIAIHVNPDILLVDEILAVGDENFQKKCLQKINGFQSEGKTIVLVSHDLQTVEKICDRVYLLHNGLLAAQGDPVEVISEYHRILYGKEEITIRPEEREPVPEAPEVPPEETAPPPPVDRWGSGEVRITRIESLDRQDKQRDSFRTGEAMTIRIHYHTDQRIEKPVFGTAFYRDDGLHINGPNTRTSGYIIDRIQGDGFIDYIIPSLPLLPGVYHLTAAIVDFFYLQTYDHWHRCFRFSVIESERIKERNGVVFIPSEWRHHGQG